MEEMFESAARSAGDMAGVFEFDGETGYFYLYRIAADGANKILGAIKISVGEPTYGPSDVHIQWSTDESLVGLVIKSQICAAFDCESSLKYGGIYAAGQSSRLPPEVLARFDGRC